MKAVSKTFRYQTKAEFDFIDITEKVKVFAGESRIKNGLVNIQTLHTTCALILNENEPLLLQDIKESLEKIAPKDLDYKHDNFAIRTINMCKEECVNGHSHCKAIRLPTNITLNLIGGKLQLGQWQEIMFVELDKARSREVQVQIIGE